MKKLIKATRIYEDTRRDCKEYIKTWGYEENTGFSRLTYGDNEIITMRTINDIQIIIDKKREYLELDVKLEIITNEKAQQEQQIINMIQSTLNNSKKGIEDFENMLK